MADLMEVLSLQRYFAWSELMRGHFERLSDQGVVVNTKTLEGQEAFCYVAYWLAGLYAVVEGWRDLRLSDETVDALISSPHVEHLRRFRNGAFHYQRDYFDSRFLELTRAPGSPQWLYDLIRALDAWFARRLPELNAEGTAQ